MQNKKEQWTVLKRLMSYLKPYGLLTFLALSFLLATTVIKSVIPLVASHFIDQYLSNLNQLAVTVLLAYYGLYILQTVVQYVGNILFARVSYSIVRDIRRDAFANMEKLGMSYFDKTPAGSIVSRLTNDTETISDMFSGILSSFISAVFIFLTTLYTMLVLDFRLTALVLLFLPLIFLLVNLYRKSQSRLSRKPEVSCRISIVSWQRISRESGLSRPLIKRSACRQNLMKSTKNTWSMPTDL